MTVLVIHNQHITRPEITQALKNNDYPFVEANSFEHGYEILTEQSGRVHAIIVNYGQLMEESSLLDKLAADGNLRDIPLILSLTVEEQENIQPFKHTAPYLWLDNPCTGHSLHTMVLSAENEFSQRRALRQEIQSRESVIGAITRGTFRIKTFEQAEALTTMLSLACPEPDRIAFGLFELLANAIEHGNLEISHTEKLLLMEKNLYRAEINRRLALPDYKDRYVEITFERESNLVSFKIEDEGPGFAYHDYLDTDLSTNHGHHGRGIALARATSFDYLEFLGKGNKVLAIASFLS